MPKTNLPEGPLAEKLYFPSLDGLRFFAFLSVFLHHLFSTYKSANPYINYFLIIFQKNGWVGVDLFFVLSGFLITMLLLQERKIYGKFSIKNFWVRRSLRIWPLYFLALLVGFILIPILLSQLEQSKHLNELKVQFIYYFLFLGNWSVVAYSYSNFRYISHLWTISIEEQFYLIWPLLLMSITNFKKSIKVCISLIIISLIVRLFLSLISIRHPGIYVNTFARFDTLTFGSFLALMYFYKPQLIKNIQKFAILPIQLFIILIFGFFLYKFYFFDPYYIKNSVFGYTIIAFFMTYFTLSALKTNSSFNQFLKYPILVYLGKISYGLYVWHILAIDIVYVYLVNLIPASLKPIFAFTLTVFIGYLSYNFFEKIFLRLKTKYSKISSRDI